METWQRVLISLVYQTKDLHALEPLLRGEVAAKQTERFSSPQRQDHPGSLLPAS